MKHRRAHRPVMRRLIAGLLAAIVGGIGSLTIATASRADMPCALSYATNFWGNPAAPQYYVTATINNTAPMTSTGWVVFVSFPTGTTTLLYWNLRSMSAIGDGFYSAADWNNAILPGQSANFGFLVATPPGVVGTPTSFTCSIF